MTETPHFILRPHRRRPAALERIAAEVVPDTAVAATHRTPPAAWQAILGLVQPARSWWWKRNDPPPRGTGGEGVRMRGLIKATHYYATQQAGRAGLCRRQRARRRQRSVSTAVRATSHCAERLKTLRFSRKPGGYGFEKCVI